MSVKALTYMCCVVEKLMKKYQLSEKDATAAVKNSYLFESLITDPAEAMHDSINSSADDVYNEIYGAI